MLEDIAYKYATQPEETLRYGFIVAGAIIAGLFHKGKGELQRSPFFAYSAMLFLVVVASQLVWLGAFSSVLGGYLWTLLLVDFGVGLTVGYTFAAVAMARSRDAYGHRSLAGLAFLPIANFWLLLTPSQKEMSENRAPTIPLLSGSFGVLTGVSLLFAGVALFNFIDLESKRMGKEAETDPTMQLAAIKMILGGQGLETVLHQIAAKAQPQRVDEWTNLMQVEADNLTLRYQYEVSFDVEALSKTMQVQFLQQNCTFKPMKLVIEAGAILEHVYKHRDGKELGTFTVTRELCGY